ncbi:MAG: Mur ligase domain-containing protein, partial [Bifidobacteriaceae bacterium]|nr:Mur ligase domain-containing protein [Bifidobacteriaceae bacterium]
MSESVHLMGIGGVGMAAVAELLVAQGLRVSGCDGKDSATLERLQALGIEVNVGHSPQHLTGLDRLILSSAILESNPELLAARRQPELVVQHRSEALAQLANVRRLVAVAGTHGKTTTSAMVVAALEAAGLEPSYAIGSELSGRDSGAHLGTGPVMVIEADESDGSFLNYQPEVAVVTNVEADHLDYYHTAAAYEAAFREFTARVQPPGVLVTDASDPGARALATAVQAGGVAADGVEVWTYGLDSGPAEPIGIPLRGRHMALNAQAALLVAQWFGA